MSAFGFRNWPGWAAATAFLVLSSAAASAQDIRLSATTMPNPFQPSYIAPAASLPVYAAPPGGFWNLPGEDVGTTEPGAAYGVLDSRRVGSIGGTADWVEVAPIENGVILGDRSVWLPYDPQVAGPFLPISGLMEE